MWRVGGVHRKGSKKIAMAKSIYPVIIILILLICVYRLIKALPEGRRDSIAVIGVIVSVVTIFAGDSVSGFMSEITESIIEFFGGQRIDFLNDCDLDHILIYDGHTYAICETKVIDDFWDAQELCKEKKGNLAVINNEAENTKLYDYFISGLEKKSAYFGYTDYDNEGNWYWVTDSKDKKASYENWCEKPNDLNGTEDYALFWYKDPPYTWNDGDFGKDSETGTVTFIIEWDHVDKSLKST